MLGVTIPKIQRRSKRVLSNTEIEIIKRAELPLKEKTFILLMLYTGLRRGEILALSKNDFDLIGHTVSVNKSVYFVGNNAELKNNPKSKAGIRTIPIPDYVHEYIALYFIENKDLIAFPSNSKGGLMTLSIFRRFWDNLIAQIAKQEAISDTLQTFNLDGDITPHILRHTYATMLYQSGVDIKTAQYLLGHSTIQMTMDVYTQLNENSISVAADKINKFMDGKSVSKSIK